MGEGSHVYGADRRATEQGYTQKMVRNVVGFENQIRRNKDESLHFFNSKGDRLLDIQGKGASVDWGPHKDKIPKNAIITHNHPRGLGKKGVAAIGSSFSQQDILTAIKNDAREIRAVTPTYTFSMKRPKGGWGLTPKEFLDSFAKVHYKQGDYGKDYLNKTNWGDVNVDRANITHFHFVMRTLAKKHGWTYTKTKG